MICFVFALCCLGRCSCLVYLCSVVVGSMFPIVLLLYVVGGGFLIGFVKVQAYPVFPSFRYPIISWCMFPIFLEGGCFFMFDCFSCCLCISRWAACYCFPHLVVMLLPPGVIFRCTAIFVCCKCVRVCAFCFGWSFFFDVFRGIVS